MTAFIPSYTAVMVSVAVAALIALAAGGALLYRSRRAPLDPEARRRALIEARGRIIEGTATDFRDGVIHYKWQWRGVDYESSQDLSAFADRLPPPHALTGLVSVKFLPSIPANSIVMSENWSGVTGPHPANAVRLTATRTKC